MHFPVYLDDAVILKKLEGWGVSPISVIRRKCYTGTDIEDGTRYVKGRFPREVVSLPYSTKFETAEGQQFCKVEHSSQVKMCRLCMSPKHLLKDYPDFTCFKCGERGHCNAVKCPECHVFPNGCECWMEEEEGVVEGQVDGQMLEGHKVDDGNTIVEQDIRSSQQRETDEGEEHGAEGESGGGKG